MFLVTPIMGLVLDRTAWRMVVAGGACCMMVAAHALFTTASLQAEGLPGSRNASLYVEKSLVLASYYTRYIPLIHPLYVKKSLV